MNKLKVVHSNGDLEDFKPRYISETIKKETNVSDELADKIQNRIVQKLYSLKKKEGLKEIGTAALRAEVSSQLLKEGEFKAEEENRKLGMSVSEFEQLLKEGCKDNANIGYSSEMIAKYSYDSISKEYALLSMPEHCAEAHKEGYVHHHDLEYFNTRPNCFNADLRFFAKNGLKIDGKGMMGSVAKPAKSLEVLLNHLLQAWMAGSTVFSGGQGYVNFNTLLAPFAKGRTYEDIKQAIQGFIFNCNMSLVCRGGQVLFSSIGIDLSIPDALANEPAIGPGGIPIGTYKEYQKEADLIFRAICEVIDEKDGSGAPHRFPNALFNIREGDLDTYDGNAKLLHELGANNPSIYYVNALKEERTVMGALSYDTPVLTYDGIKYPADIKIGDKVMTYEKDGRKTWQEVYNVIEKEIPEKIFKITCDNGYILSVTDNHKLPTSDGIVKSEDLEIGMELYNYVDEKVTDLTPNYEAQFIGMFLADGYIRSSRFAQKNSRNIEFHIKREDKKKKILDVIKKCNYNYEIQNKKDKSISIIVKEEELRNELEKLYDENKEKTFPFVLDKNYLFNIIEGLKLDGRQGSKTRFEWSCSDKKLVDSVSLVLSYLGYTTTIYHDNRAGETGSWRTNFRISFGFNYNPKNKTKIKSIEIIDNNKPVYDLSIKNNHNYVCGLGGIHSENCRTALPMNYHKDYELDCMNTGNFMYSTINLPLLALESDTEEEFYQLLDKYCEIIYDTLIFRRQEVEKVLYDYHMSDFLLQKDKETGKQLYELDRTTMTIGYCGLNECLLELYDQDITQVQEKGINILKFLNEKKQKFFERDGMRWSVIASPAESTSHRFAKINKEKYPDAIVQGKKNNYYLTNSHHIPVESDVNLIKHIKNADRFHELSAGGCILHLWLGEVWSDAEALWSLNKKIINSNVTFWAYSKVFTVCNECGYNINDKLDKCLICDSPDVTTYDRVTGYYLPTSTWNNGKKQEFYDRFRHKIESLFEER